MINPFASKKKEHVSPIGGAMGVFDEEFEQGLEDRLNKGPQILGSITFNLPDFAPAVSEVVDAFYGLKKDIFGIAQTPTEQPPQVEQTEKEAIFVRDRARALQEEMQRLTVTKQEELMRDALRMGVNVIDVVTEAASNITNPIQAQREAGRMEALGISDVVTVVNKVEVQDAQVEEAEKDQSLQAARTSAIANAAEGGSGQVGSSTRALANLSTTGGGAG